VCTFSPTAVECTPATVDLSARETETYTVSFSYVSYSDRLVVAIDVGGTSLKGAVVDHLGHVVLVDRRQTQRERGPEAAVQTILKFAEDLVELSRHRVTGGHVLAAGVAVPGLVDEHAGVGLLSANLGWRNVPLRRLLHDRLGMPVALGHDDRAAALAEQLLGAARGYEEYLFLTLGTGVGAAVVLHGAPYLGAHGLGGEFGHMCVQPEGPVCSCGHKGCVEALASATAVTRRYQELAPSSSALSAREIAERVSSDMVAAQVWDEAVAALSVSIANYTALLDPGCVVIGGGMATAGPALFRPLQERLALDVRFQAPPPVVPALLGEDAGYLGAALLAWLTLGVPRSALAWRT
jgi:glucokinase